MLLFFKKHNAEKELFSAGEWKFMLFATGTNSRNQHPNIDISI